MGRSVVGAKDGATVGNKVGDTLGSPVGILVGAALVGLGVDVSIVGSRVVGASDGPLLGA